MPIRLAQLNQLDQDAFAELLGGIFEHSPWVARQAWTQRPFARITALHDTMCRAVADAGETAQLALIRAHPTLAGKAAIRGELTPASSSEQSGAGLGECSAEEYASITALNRAYEERYGFPFILAVRGHTRQSIIAQMRSRIGNTHDEELAQALLQIERIAGFRLADTIRED